MRFWLLRTAFWFWFSVRGYYLWSKVWRKLLERGYSNQKLTKYDTIGELEANMAKMTWVADPFFGYFDVISSPEKVEALLQQKLAGKTVEAEVGDCDEFAQYAAVAIEGMISRGSLLRCPSFVSINWLDKDGKFHGHNVCCFFDAEVGVNGWCHIGNWGNGLTFRGYESISDIARWFAEGNPRDGKGRLIGYAVATPELQFKEMALG